MKNNKIHTHQQALDFLFSLISSTQSKFPGEFGLNRSKFLLKLLDNPQNKIKTIHIAGTSGKGSTAYLINEILHEFGFKTGLHLSPHLLDIRERFKINNQLISNKKFVEYLNKILPAVEKTAKSKYGQPSYFEILVALAFYVFYKEKVDYAIVETGMGGQFDATNVISNPQKIAILTKIGFDHTRILGKTLPKIAEHKAGIIQKNNLAISAWGNKKTRAAIEKAITNIETSRKVKIAKKVLQQPTQKQREKIFFLKASKNFPNVKTAKDKTIFDYKFEDITLKNLQLNLLGKHQAENCSLALTAIKLLSKRDNFEFCEKKIRSALKKASFKGRFEIKKYKNQEIILDGAHNPQKIASLLKSLKSIYKSNNKFNFLVAFKKGKDAYKILKAIIPYADHITLTDFFSKKDNLKHLSHNQEELEKVLKKLNFKNFSFISPSENAFTKSLEYQKKSKTKTPLVITGSLYLIAEVLTYMK